jgi:cytochrome c556
MSIRTCLFLAAAVLALGLWGVSAPAADEKSQNDTIDKLAETLQKDSAAAKKEAAALAKTVDTDDLMGVLNKRKTGGEGGFGFGPKATGEKDDSIEKKVESLGDPKNAPLSAAQLAKESADLQKMTQRIAAVALVAAAKPAPKTVADKPVPAKDLKKWDEYAEIVAKSTKELNKAIQDKDPKAVQAAASRMDGACKDCHVIWR